MTGTAPRQPNKTQLGAKQLKMLFARIGETIEAETRLLKSNPAADLTEANARKNRCLYELNLISRELGRFDLDDGIRVELLELRRKVNDNAAAIRANMSATRDVIGILGDAITRAESDGTYPATSRLPSGYYE